MLTKWYENTIKIPNLRKIPSTTPPYSIRSEQIPLWHIVCPLPYSGRSFSSEVGCRGIILKRGYTFLYGIVFIISCAAPNAYARPKTVTNLSDFIQIAGTPYLCTSVAGATVLAKLRGTMTLAIGATYKEIKTRKTEKKVSRLERKLVRLRSKKPTRRRLKKIARLESKHSKKQSKLDTLDSYLTQCGSGSGGGEEIGDNEFLGNTTSLQAYRNELTDREIDHLLGTVAFGGSEELRQIGRVKGLSALVDALVDGVTTAKQNQELQDDALAWARHSMWLPEEDPSEHIWTAGAIEQGQFYRFLNTRNPFHEWMVLVLSHHFSLDIDGIGFAYNQYAHHGLQAHWELLLRESVGNFQSLTRSMFSDSAMNAWLQNYYNTKNSPNQNYARELLELFSLGAVDPISQAPNYGEDTIIAATAYVSGFLETLEENPVTGNDMMSIAYDSERHDSGAYTAFAGIQGAEITASMGPDEFLNHVFANHPGAPRYIAERIAGQMLYPGLSESVVQTLANTLRNNNYELKPMLKQILRSEAMFSRGARRSCIDSPLEHFVRLMRRVMPEGIKNDLDLNRRNQTIWTIWNAIYAASGSGQHLFEPDSVFGFKGSCNINRNGEIAYGEGWLSSQRLLNRSRGCIDIMNNMNSLEHDFVGALALRQGMTSGEIVTHVATQVYGLSLTSEEQSLLVQFLTGDLPSFQTLNTSDEYFIRSRITRLICLIGSTFETNVR